MIRRTLYAAGLAAALLAQGAVQTPALACADTAAMFNPDADADLIAAITERRFKAAERLMASTPLDGIAGRTGGALIQSILFGHGERQLTPQTVRLMRALLDAGANPDAIRPGGYTPLMIVTNVGEDPALSLQMIDALLAAGADINAVSNFGDTALHGTAYEGNAHAAEILLARGADPTIRDEEGATAADTARASGHIALADRLAAAGG